MGQVLEIVKRAIEDENKYTTVRLDWLRRRDVEKLYELMVVYIKII